MVANGVTAYSTLDQLTAPSVARLNFNMDGNCDKNIGSPSRARGHSFMSILKSASHHEDGHGYANGGHPGIPIERLREGTVEDVTKVTEDLSSGDFSAPEAPVSALTVALQGMGA